MINLLPRGSTVALSTVGTADSVPEFLTGFDHLLASIDPPSLVVFGVRLRDEIVVRCRGRAVFWMTPPRPRTLSTMTTSRAVQII